MTKRLPLPAPSPHYFCRTSGLGSPPELSVLSHGAEPEHHTQHFVLRRGAGASSQGQDQLCPPPLALAPPAPHALYEEQLGARGHLRIPPAPNPQWGLQEAGGAEVAVKALPRHCAQDSAPSCGTRALALQKKYTSDVCPSV